MGTLRDRAAEKVRELKEEGLDPQPVTGVSARGKIANSFWGHSWCRHLELHCDYENRLPRGRSYVRNGAVVHLDIDPGEVNALVMGSELYELSIRFDPLSSQVWQSILESCRGQIGSMVELLQGKLSDKVMERVTDPGKGLFPQPGEMHFNCNCLDWADMCKHVAAVLYGIGARLDEEPELLFRLRGVNHQELLESGCATENLLAGLGNRSRRTLDVAKIRDVFGIEPEGFESLQELLAEGNPGKLDDGSAETEVEIEKEPEDPDSFDGEAIRSLRVWIGLNEKSFAAQLGISAKQLAEWEAAEGVLPLNEEQKEFLKEIQKEKSGE
ncbi:putative Zn finger protein [Puniceicoccus vermicola]